MNTLQITFASQRLFALGTGALWWPGQQLLCVSDLHLGKSERVARRGGPALPPYEVQDTLNKLATDLAGTAATTVVCLGDSFDDLQASQTLDASDRLRIAAMQAGRRWIWIEGNHDPGPVELGGEHLAEWTCDTLVFRHIAQTGAQGEVSGHYHPKAGIRLRGRTLTRPAFLVDDHRLILPAYGTYTGGLRSTEAALCELMQADAQAVLTGPKLRIIPMPRGAR